MELDFRRTRIKNLEENTDRLTDLPEHLLHHILSFLSMRDVIRTCVISKKWRYIWLSVPYLNFPSPKMPLVKEIDFITRCLLLYKAPTIQKLNISLKTRVMADSHQVDWWIQFALTRYVKELHLEFIHGCLKHHTLHQYIFGCSFLTVLELKLCNMNISREFKFCYLKTLLLEEVHFSGGSVFDLISSCPHLERVSIIACNLNAGPRQSITNVALKTLRMHTGNNQTSSVEVDAPYLVSFEFGALRGCIENKCVFKQMHALEKASFVCSASHDFCSFNLKMWPAIYRTLGSVCHVKTLRLDSCYMEILSLKEKRGPPSSFNVKYLEIQTGLTRMEIPGLAHMLKYSPNLETLVINIEKICDEKFNRNSYDKHYIEEGGYWKDEEPIVCGMFKKLKMVRVQNFMINLHVVKVKREKTKTKDYIKKLKNDMEFLKFLLKNCEVLEKMTITTRIDVKPEKMYPKLWLTLKQELQAACGRNLKISIM